MPAPDAELVVVHVVIVVSVDPTEPELLALVAKSGGSTAIADIVCNEVESNLESVSYVRYVDVKKP